MSILAAIGGEHEQDRIVEVGYDLATRYDDELVALHVISEDRFEELRERGAPAQPVAVSGGDEGTSLAYSGPDQSEPAYSLEDAERDAESVARECLLRTLGEGHYPAVVIKGRVGDAGEEIVSEADRIDARYIVVGGRKRSPVRKALFGSVSQWVITHSDRPVVAITRAEEGGS